MTYEFEGKTEKEAIDNAVAELDLEVDQFDVEILDIQKGGFFKKGSVKIRVHVDDSFIDGEHSHENSKTSPSAFDSNKKDKELTDEVIQATKNFLGGVVGKMGYDCEVDILNRENNRKLIFKVASEHAPHLIGKRGKTLDALQLFTNIYLSKMGYPQIRAIVDCENYRCNKEENIIRSAYETADKVISTKHSVLLEPMNPYERRLVHTTLSNVNFIETKSEGKGLYKQVRIFYKK